ncbi:spore coat protein CotJB [Sporolactobacillus kofuensis]|uniref:Spore coat protein CotJB n=1 Tax=Sporolactobacillus kofuensis TaxID=269672 RepID=A0ABW1WGJ5_9BACL|nr:spore coat protein CotJB [Sporolactobacillus kofuensis]MCO7176620.1 spore coat protein CotJB [Sporolactobacillus kofuensis]
MAEPKPVPESYYSDLKSLQAIDFVLVELTLYLDTHPNDLDALKQFNSAAKKSAELRQDFEAKYGPLQQFGQSLSAYPWQWKDTPWPWQV